MAGPRTWRRRQQLSSKTIKSLAGRRIGPFPSGAQDRVFVRERSAYDSSRRSSRRWWRGERGDRWRRASWQGPEDPVPFSEGLIGSDQHRAPLVACADELEQHTGLGLVLGDVGK